MKGNPMRKTLLTLLAALTVAPLVLGQVTTCPDQVYLPLDGYPVVLDVNQISMDRPDPNDPAYALRKPLLLNVIAVPVGTPAVHVGHTCDPDGEEVRIRCGDGTLTMLSRTGQPVGVTPVGGWYAPAEGGAYRWSWTPQQLGVTYHWVEAVDVRPETNNKDVRYTRGTIAVVGVPPNASPPRLCGGLPQ
jgi:hypothetical protein